MEREVMTLGSIGRSSMSRLVFTFGALGCFMVWLLFRSFSTEIGDVSLAGWTWKAGMYYTGFLSALFVPLIFAGMVWWWSHLQRNEEVSPSYWGLGWLSLGMVIYWAGVRVGQPRWALFSLPFLVVGLVHYGLGGRMAWALAPAAFFLWFLIPVPGLEGLIVGRMLMTEITATAEVAGWLGMGLTREGSTLKGSGGEFHLSTG